VTGKLQSHTKPIRDELSWHFINFMHSCLSSDSDIVRFVAHHGVFCRRMLSPIGRNAQYCNCSRYNASLASFTSLNKSSVWRHVRAAVSADVWNTVVCILELLFIRCHFYTLELFTLSEIDSIINFMCTVLVIGSLFFFT